MNPASSQAFVHREGVHHGSLKKRKVSFFSELSVFSVKDNLPGSYSVVKVQRGYAA